MSNHTPILLRLMLVLAAGCLVPRQGVAQVYNQMDESGNITQRDEQEQENKNFNPHKRDSTGASPEIPRGMRVWTVDRKFGDIRPAVADTMPHLYMNSIFNTGLHHEYNSTGNNYTARQNRIFADRGEQSQFMFTDAYDYMYKQPDQFHFTNTLSPLTNLSYDNCGDKENGEDHIDTRFAVNANKRAGFGFDLNYAYARGYFSNQSTSHFGATLYGSYLGDQYQMHALFSTYHQKVSENGGIANDEYVKHPEGFNEDYTEDEIPTVMSQNWNRNDHLHLFLTHRYSVGFYRKEEMTDEEKNARRFAAAAKKENDAKDKKKRGSKGEADVEAPMLAGRPDGAKIADGQPSAPADSTDLGAGRIKVDSQAKMDSLLALEQKASPADTAMKQAFVPVTSFIHTLEANNYNHIYQAYASAANYYGNTYFTAGRDRNGMAGDSIYDKSRMLQVKNTLALALNEGFNKYAKAGLKAFVSHELRQFYQPDTLESLSFQRRYTEHNISLGGKLSKTEGSLLHYTAQAETWVVGEDAGQLKLDATADLNLRLLGDTVQLAARAYLHRLNATFFQRQFHSKHIWWDNDDMSKETRTRLEGTLSFNKTNTRLRVAIEEMQNYTYYGMNYSYEASGNNYSPVGLVASVNQHGGNINVMTAQLMQDFRLGPLHLDNIVTWQNSSNTDVLPLPTLNVYANLYLKFRIAKELLVELGGDVSYFTTYFAPDFCPQLNQFAVQENEESRIELGNYPYVNVYANMHLKRARFFVMMSNATSGMANKMAFLAPHYPTNSNILRLGVSWNFYN